MKQKTPARGFVGHHRMLFFSHNITKLIKQTELIFQRICMHIWISSFPEGSGPQAALGLRGSPSGLPWVGAQGPGGRVLLSRSPPLPLTPLPRVWDLGSITVSRCLSFSQSVFLCIFGAVTC